MDMSLDSPMSDVGDSPMNTTSSGQVGDAALERFSVSQVPPQQGDRCSADDTVLAVQRCYNDLSPVFKLTDDILSRIMMLYRDISHAGFVKQSQICRWLTVTFVCRRWRTLALGSPLLWNRIYWNATEARNPPTGWIVTFLQRSAEVPLDLHVRLYHLHINIQDLLISHSFRWRNVVLRAAPAHIPSLFRRLEAPTPLLESFKIIQDAGFFAGLREDSMSSSDMESLVLPENTFGGHARNLRLLSLSNRIYVHPNNPFLPSLTSLEVYWNLHQHDVLAVLASTSNLHSLQILRIPATVLLRIDGVMDEPAGHFSHDDPIQLSSSLQDLGIWSSLPRHCIHLLTHLHLPTLRRLRIDIVSIYNSDETASLLDALLPFTHMVQRNEGPIHGIYLSHHSSAFTVVGWSFTQIQALNNRSVRPEVRHARFNERPLDQSTKPTFYLSYSDMITRRDGFGRVLDTACRQIPLNHKAVRVLALNITMERTCAEWKLAFSLWPAIERLELFEDLSSASWTFLEAATPNLGGQPDFLFPCLKKLVFSGRIRPDGGHLQHLAENRKAAGIPIEIDFTECVWRSVDIATTLQQFAKVTWDGEEWMPFSIDNFEQIPDVDGQGVWGDMFDM